MSKTQGYFILMMLSAIDADSNWHYLGNLNAVSVTIPAYIGIFCLVLGVLSFFVSMYNDWTK
jgi:hypothetical protein